MRKILLSHLRRKDNTAISTLHSAFLENSMAVIILSPHDVAIISAAESIMTDFFSLDSTEKLSTKKLVEELPGCSTLLGYNRPSLAKECYRIKREGCSVSSSSFLSIRCEKKCRDCLIKISEANVCRHDAYSWPSSLRAQKEAQLQAIMTALGLLEEIALLVLTSLLNFCLTETSCSVLAAYSMLTPLYSSDGAALFASSPFDFFHYYNKSNAELCDTTPNCSIHVDPGFLTLVPSARVPGLALLSRQEEKFIWPEVSASPLQDVVVFSGRTLELLSQTRFPAVYHRVDRPEACMGVEPSPQLQAQRDRLALVYELRPAAGLNATVPSVLLADSRQVTRSNNCTSPLPLESCSPLLSTNVLTSTGTDRSRKKRIRPWKDAFHH